MLRMAMTEISVQASAETRTGELDRHFYAQMMLIRRTEETFFDLYAQGKMSGTVHTSIGQEACAVGVVAALDRTWDVIFSNHRAHGHFLAYCDDVEGVGAVGRVTGHRCRD